MDSFSPLNRTAVSKSTSILTGHIEVSDPMIQKVQIESSSPFIPRQESSLDIFRCSINICLFLAFF